MILAHFASNIGTVLIGAPWSLLQQTDILWLHIVSFHNRIINFHYIYPLATLGTIRLHSMATSSASSPIRRPVRPRPTGQDVTQVTTLANRVHKSYSHSIPMSYCAHILHVFENNMALQALCAYYLMFCDTAGCPRCFAEDRPCSQPCFRRSVDRYNRYLVKPIPHYWEKAERIFRKALIYFIREGRGSFSDKYMSSRDAIVRHSEDPSAEDHVYMEPL